MLLRRLESRRVCAESLALVSESGKEEPMREGHQDTARGRLRRSQHESARHEEAYRCVKHARFQSIYLVIRPSIPECKGTLSSKQNTNIRSHLKYEKHVQHPGQ